MKKTITFVLSLCICFLSAVFVGCDLDASVHTHAYKSEWSYDENEHWHDCEGCSATCEKAQHAFVENVCATCGYEKPTSPTPTPEPEPTPSTNWASYFVFENVTVTKTTEINSDSGLDCKVTERLSVKGKQWLWQGTYRFYLDDALYSSETSVVYFDGKNAYKDGTLSDAGSYHLSEFFSRADFSAYESSFTQTSSGVYEASEIKTDDVTYKNARMTIENGKIASLSVTAEHSLVGSVQTEETISYVFSDWGKTSFDGTKYTSVWQSYLRWTNVTIQKTMTYDKDGTTTKLDLQTTWKVDDDKWICYQDYEAVDGQLMTMTTIYYDGTKGYIDGEESDNFGWYHHSYDGILGDLEESEGAFEKTEQSETTVLYTAESITLYGVTAYTNVQITVQNGRIVKIEYDMANAVMEGDEIYSGRCTYVFTDYGTTKIDYKIAA